jgi:hypothetical protein
VAPRVKPVAKLDPGGRLEREGRARKQDEGEKGGTKEEQRRNKGGTKEEQRRDKGGTKEEQRRSSKEGRPKEGQRRDKGGTEEGERRNKGGTKEELERRRTKGGTKEEAIPEITTLVEEVTQVLTIESIIGPWFVVTTNPSATTAEDPSGFTTITS